MNVLVVLLIVVPTSSTSIVSVLETFTAELCDDPTELRK
jgi:hypothetical protein